MIQSTSQEGSVTILISACLLGERVRYDGNDVFCGNSSLYELQNQGRLIPFCPELAGGMPIPRPPSEIIDGGGKDVLTGEAKVLDIQGKDVTDQFLQGAEKALKIAELRGSKLAILKDRSPSCGVTFIHDGTFSGITIPGQGVAAALLEQHGIRVFSEEQIEQAAAYVNALE